MRICGKMAAMAVGLVLTFASGVHAQRIVTLNPEEAGPDFAIQGEYVGMAGPTRLGAQIIALGNGEFRAVFLNGGLPGEGWDQEGRAEVPGRRGRDAEQEEGEERVLFEGDGWQAEVVEGRLVGRGPRNLAYTLDKVQRQSPTLGAQPPEGAVVLFDGSDADQWQPGRMENGHLMMGAISRQSFADHKLHLEFMTPFMPQARGQGRGNSGVYIQRRYEVQVLDSFGLRGDFNECGGIYRVAAPLVNMCFPPLSWQTFEIDFTAARFDEDGNKTANARMTVHHNGVLIHDDVEIPGQTGGGQRETAQPGPIYLQNHSNPVIFRNIWVVERKAEAGDDSAGAARAPGIPVARASRP